MGATTIWERWNSVREDGTFGPVSMNSLNHYAFGAICEWLYRYVAGINPTQDGPGFHRSCIRPMPNDMLAHAEGSIRTQYGLLRSGWRLEGKRIRIEIEIPFNTQAEIILPIARKTGYWKTARLSRAARSRAAAAYGFTNTSRRLRPSPSV